MRLQYHLPVSLSCVFIVGCLTNYVMDFHASLKYGFSLFAKFPLHTRQSGCNLLEQAHMFVLCSCLESVFTLPDSGIAAAAGECKSPLQKWCGQTEPEQTGRGRGGLEESRNT